jgi:glycosyltransferase involved in cell wall biosynthesis
MGEPQPRRETSQPPLNVCLVLAASTGGIGRHVGSLAADLAESGHRVRVVAPASTGARFAFGQLARVEYTATEADGTGRFLASVRRLARLTAGFDVVHAHGLRAGGATALALRWNRWRRRGTRNPALVVTLHNAAAGARPRRAAWRMVVDVVARDCDVLLAVSPDLVDLLRARHRNVERALIAAPALLPSRTRDEARAGLGVADGTPMVFAVGRLHAQKGFDVLIASTPGLATMRPQPVIAIAGEGPCREELERLIASAPLDVRLLGNRDDIADLLVAADVVAMPSRWEGWPLAAAEVLAAGRPFVATAVGGLPELVADAAILVPQGDAGALAAAIKSVLVDPSVAARLVAAAIARTGQLPAVSDVTATVVGIYHRARRP